jgi:hypothetical protein
MALAHLFCRLDRKLALVAEYTDSATAERHIIAVGGK